MQTETDKPILISNITQDQSKSFAKALSDHVGDLNGVLGPTPAADEFASSWINIKKCKINLGANLRLFELTSVVKPRLPDGSARLAIKSDRQLLFQWLKNFDAEAVPHDPRRSDNDLFQVVDEATEKNQFFLWEVDGKCVCLVGSRRETLTERWIAPVYTPTHLRGRGYASALVAFVSQKILESGKKAMLFTDLANPTSNSIYKKVGYKTVADFKHFLFV
jgi:uncharacterized protein